MKSKKDLYDEYELINSEIESEISNLKYLLENSLIEYINLLNIHFILKDLIFKRKCIKDEIYDSYHELITDEI